MIRGLTLFLSGFFLFSLSLSGANSAGYLYTVEWLPEAERTFLLTVETAPQKGKSTQFKIPAWRPGRYILQNYAAAISHFQAWDANGKILAFQKIDKDTWEVSNPEKGIIRVQYRFYAGILDAGSSYIAKDLYYFNGVNLFLYVPDRLNVSCRVKIPALQKLGNTLKVATALPSAGQTGSFLAKDYHNLVDCPVILSSRIHTIEFTEGNAKFYLHFQGNYRGTPESDQWLQKAAARLFREQAAVFNSSFPFSEYHCLYLLTPYNFRHAVEHATSSCYTLPDEVTTSTEGMRYGVLGITSHEFFHVWNVKRFRPAAMQPYDYSKEAYTRLHWFTEGVTSYMEQLTLARADLRSESEFLSHLSTISTSLDNAYASGLLSCEESSWDSWLSQSRNGNPYHRVSFYTQGERVGFLLDLLLRKYSPGNQGIEVLFRKLEEQYGKTGKGIPENGIEQVAIELAGPPAQLFFAKYVKGTGPFEYADFLPIVGLQALRVPDSLKTWERLGIQAQKESGGIFIRTQVRPGSDAAKAGIADDDLIAELFNKPLAEADITRLTRLQPGDTIPVRVISGNISQSLLIHYSGNALPFILKFQADPQAGTEVVLTRESWIHSLLPDEKENQSN